MVRFQRHKDARPSGNHVSCLAWIGESDDSTPDAIQSGHVIQRWRIAQNHCWRTGNPRRRRCGNTGHGSWYAHSGSRRGRNHRIRGGLTHPEGWDVHDRYMVHDVRRHHMTRDDCFGCRHQGTGSHAKRALHHGSHACLHGHRSAFVFWP